MKFTQLWFAAAFAGLAQAGTLDEHDTCYVKWNSGAGKYQDDGDKCGTKLQCVYHVGDDGNTTQSIAGQCETEGCYGTNSNQPPAEGTYRVTICHRTCSENNPWVRITIDEDGWDGAGCGHKQHRVYEDCNMNNKDINSWKMGLQPQDYLIKRHGTRDHVRAVIAANNPGKSNSELDKLEKDYWAEWEPACPYVRGTNCCDWDKGECCGHPSHSEGKIAMIHGDPHVKRWNRKPFQWHGECDMVFTKVESLQVKTGTTYTSIPLDLHVRTSITDHWSAVTSAAIRLGSTILQVDAGGVYSLNKGGAPSFPLNMGNGITATKNSAGGVTNITIPVEKSSIVFSTVGDFVNVYVSGHVYDFGDAVGLAGNFDGGRPINRQGYRIVDLDAHINSWQVDHTTYQDPVLFKETRQPQAPGAQCTMPSTSARRRNLRADKDLYSRAVKACQGKRDFNLCVEDVVNTGEENLAIFHE